jgi:hypothetical protein
MTLEMADYQTTTEDEVPAAVAMVMSALEAGRPNEDERRAERRIQHRVAALLRLFSDRPNSTPWLLYTRDLSARGLGFISRHRLPLGYGGIVEFTGPDGKRLNAHCTLLRCREAAPGWFEGTVYFNREQRQLDSAF